MHLGGSQASIRLDDMEQAFLGNLDRTTACSVCSLTPDGEKAFNPVRIQMAEFSH